MHCSEPSMCPIALPVIKGHKCVKEQSFGVEVAGQNKNARGLLSQVDSGLPTGMLQKDSKQLIASRKQLGPQGSSLSHTCVRGVLHGSTFCIHLFRVCVQATY